METGSLNTLAMYNITCYYKVVAVLDLHVYSVEINYIFICFFFSSSSRAAAVIGKWKLSN